MSDCPEHGHHCRGESCCCADKHTGGLTGPVIMISLSGDLDDSGPYWDAATRYLAARMSEVSEEAVCATWEYGLEGRIWRIGRGGEDHWLYDAEACRRLVELGQELQCWWVWPWGPTGPEGGGPRRVTMDEWTAIFLAG